MAPMQYGRTLTVAGALALAACGAAVGAMGITDFKAMQQGIEAQARAAHLACGKLGGTARAPPFEEPYDENHPGAGYLSRPVHG